MFSVEVEEVRGRDCMEWCVTLCVDGDIIEEEHFFAEEDAKAKAEELEKEYNHV